MSELYTLFQRDGTFNKRPCGMQLRRLEKFRKNNFAKPPLGQTACRLESKARILDRRIERHRSTVRHPACVLYPLSSDPGCRTAVQLARRFMMALKSWPRSWCARECTLASADPACGWGSRRLRAQPHFLSACLHDAGTVATPCTNCGSAASRHHRRIGPAAGQLGASLVGAVDPGSRPAEPRRAARDQARVRLRSESAARR